MTCRCRFCCLWPGLRSHSPSWRSLTAPTWTSEHGEGLFHRQPQRSLQHPARHHCPAPCTAGCAFPFPTPAAGAAAVRRSCTRARDAADMLGSEGVSGSCCLCLQVLRGDTRDTGKIIAWEPVITFARLFICSSGEEDSVVKHRYRVCNHVDTVMEVEQCCTSEERF